MVHRNGLRINSLWYLLITTFILTFHQYGTSEYDHWDLVGLWTCGHNLRQCRQKVWLPGGNEDAATNEMTACKIFHKLHKDTDEDESMFDGFHRVELMFPLEFFRMFQQFRWLSVFSCVSRENDRWVVAQTGMFRGTVRMKSSARLCVDPSAGTDEM